MAEIFGAFERALAEFRLHRPSWGQHQVSVLLRQAQERGPQETDDGKVSVRYVGGQWICRFEK